MQLGNNGKMAKTATSQLGICNKSTDKMPSTRIWNQFPIPTLSGRNSVSVGRRSPLWKKRNRKNYPIRSGLGLLTCRALRRIFRSDCRSSSQVVDARRVLAVLLCMRAWKRTGRKDTEDSRGTPICTEKCLFPNETFYRYKKNRWTCCKRLPVVMMFWLYQQT